MQEINFNEKEHKYYDDTGLVYTSVTTLIEKYTKTYDTNFWAMYTGLKERGLRVKPEPENNVIFVGGRKEKVDKLYKDSLYSIWAEEVKLKWKGITLEACIRGNNVHNELEDSINLSKGDIGGNTNKLITRGNNEKKPIETLHDLDKTKLEERYPEVYKRLKGYIELGYSIFAEKRVHLPEYAIAGMIDVPLLQKGYFCILDWKTNKDELHNTAGYYKKERINGVLVKTDKWIPTDERLNYPLNMIPASKFHKYALQLSTYAFILEKWGYKLVPNGLEIIHFPLGSPPRLIKIPYLKDEVELMLNHHILNC